VGVGVIAALVVGAAVGAIVVGVGVIAALVVGAAVGAIVVGEVVSTDAVVATEFGANVGASVSITVSPGTLVFSGTPAFVDVSVGFSCPSNILVFLNNMVQRKNPTIKKPAKIKRLRINLLFLKTRFTIYIIYIIYIK